MDITELKNAIIKKNLSNFYIFTGTEIGIQNIYLEQMSKVYGMPVTRADSVSDIYAKCTTKSLWGDEAGFYVIRNDFDFMKQEKIYETIVSKIKKNVIVLLYEKIDSRLKFGKFFKDCTVVFEKLAPNILNSYIKKEGLSSESAAELSNKVSGSYDMAMLEVDKIRHYASVSGRGMNDSFEELLEQGVIYQPEDADVFNFTDAICSGDPVKTVKIAQILLDNKVSAINVLGTLYNSMKTILLIQCCENKNVCETTGLDNRQVYFNKKYVNIYDTQELVQAVKLIARVIAGIKSGWIDESYAVRYTICKIM